MKNVIFMILLSASFLISAAAESHCFEVEIGQFDKVKVLDNVNVVYRCLPDSTGFVQYSATDDFEDAFIIKCNDKGTLRIQVASEALGKENLPVLYIYSDFLLSVENSSAYELDIESMAPCPEFKATQVGNGTINIDYIKASKVSAIINTGNGTINLAGECETASFKMIGAGLISADRLKAESVSCTIVGTGSIGCWPANILSVRGIGSTKIYYKGDPTIKKSGGGKLFRLPEATSSDTDNQTIVSTEEEE